MGTRDERRFECVFHVFSLRALRASAFRRGSGYAGFMRPVARLMVLVLVLAASTTLRAQMPAPPAQALLDSLASALESTTIDSFLASSAPALTAGERDWLRAQAPATVRQSVTIRERAQAGGLLAADALISRGERAIVASWQVGVARDPDGHLSIASIAETSRIDNLVTLEPDATRLLTVRNLVVTGPDFVLTVPSGVALASRIDGAWTALAVQGRSTIAFTPHDPTEQGQLRIFANAPRLETTADAVFVRLNPVDVPRFVRGSIEDHPRPDPAAVGRLERLFAERADAGQGLDLGDLSTRRWSVGVRPGNLLVEFRTRRDGWLTYTTVPETAEDVALTDRARRRQIALYTSTAANGGALSITTSSSDERPYTIEHTDIDIVSDPDRHWLRGRASLRLRVNSQTRVLTLRLADSLRVTSASSPTLGPLLALRSSSLDSGAIIGLPHVLNAGDTPTIDLQFEGTLPPQALDDDTPAFEQKADVMDVLSVTPRWLYSHGTAWYPQPDTTHHATATIRITVPASFEVVATGRRTSVTTSTFGEDPPGHPARSSRTVTFAADRPVRYLAFLAARMNEVSRAEAEPPAMSDVEVFSVPATVARRRPDAGSVRDILAFFSHHLGEAPYPPLSLVVLEDRLPSGHSPAYFALVNHALPTTPYSWRNDPVAFDDIPNFFLAHELAHQWWGQAVAGRTYREQWISEGFAQYMAWMYVASVQGPEVAERLMSRMRASAEAFVAEGPIHLGFRLGHLRNDRRVFRAVAYNKAAVVLHMLRRLMGDESFMTGLRELATTHRFSLIDTSLVQRVFQAQTDIPLQRFFQQWVRGADLPQLRLTWSHGGDGTIAIDIEQRGPVFDLPHTAVVYYADGTRQRVPLSITAATERVIVPVSGRVRRVELSDALTPARVVR